MLGGNPVHPSSLSLSAMWSEQFSEPDYPPSHLLLKSDTISLWCQILPVPLILCCLQCLWREEVFRPTMCQLFIYFSNWESGRKSVSRSTSCRKRGTELQEWLKWTPLQGNSPWQQPQSSALTQSPSARSALCSTQEGLEMGTTSYRKSLF